MTPNTTATYSAKPDPLPTAKQQELLGWMIGRAFVEIRLLGAEGRSQQAADLAEAFHNIPREMYDDRVFHWSLFRNSLQQYQEKWGNDPATVCKFDYVGMLLDIQNNNFDNLPPLTSAMSWREIR